MKTALAALATLLLVACTPAGAPTPQPASAQPPAPAAPADAFEAALAAARLTKVDLKQIDRQMTHDLGSTTPVEGRRLSLTVSAGWNAESIEFAKDASGRVVRVIRRPVETVKETVIEGCQDHVFAGGRGWFERVVLELPEGATWGGEVIVKYPSVREVVRFTGKTRDGKPCPPPAMMLD